VRLRWLPASRQDIARLYEFLAAAKGLTAARKIDEVLVAVETLPDFPRVGRLLDKMAPREVRAWIIDDYEIRYELTKDMIIILRIWHSREDR
jgi:plasmid stabilization system protein ParE